MARAERIGWVDWVRALGAGSVVLLHVLVSTGLAARLGLGRRMAYAVVGIVLARWAVPGFFMVSGLLLLDPARPLGWGRALRHTGRMAGVLATFGVAFALMEEAWGVLIAGGAPTWGLVPRAVGDVIRMATWDHLWYVYAMLAVYPLAPVLHALRVRWGERGFAALALACALVGLVVPTAWAALAEARVCPPLPDGAPWLFGRNVGAGVACFAVGGCLRAWRLDRRVAVAGLGSLATMLATSLWGLSAGRGDEGFVFLQWSCLACCYAVFVLLLVRRAAGDGPVPPQGAVARLSRYSFGVYVLHPLFIHLALLVAGPQDLPPVLFEAALFAGAYGASTAATWALLRVPVVDALL